MRRPARVWVAVRFVLATEWRVSAIELWQKLKLRDELLESRSPTSTRMRSMSRTCCSGVAGTPRNASSAPLSSATGTLACQRGKKFLKFPDGYLLMISTCAPFYSNHGCKNETIEVGRKIIIITVTCEVTSRRILDVIDRFVRNPGPSVVSFVIAIRQTSFDMPTIGDFTAG